MKKKYGLRVLSLVLCAALAVALHAASTGTTALHTPQGRNAGLGFGDYVSDASGLIAPYRYFVEVPSGQTQLTLQVFDPDIGLGGTAEATAGRDRDRNGFDTTATYSVYDPTGTSKPVLFTTGDDTQPVGSDNAWTTLLSWTGDYARDEFGTAAYNNQNGSINFSTDWAESNDDTDPAAGLIRITGGELRIEDNGLPASSIQRQVNLSAFSGATLSYNYRTTGVDAGDVLLVQASNNGGGSWTTIATYTGPQAASTASINIGAYIATNTRIQFIASTGYGNNDFFFVDNVQIRDSSIRAGHWEIRVDMSTTANTTRDDINAIGIRAHDGDSTSGGTEFNVYADSFVALGVNPPAAGTNSRAYQLYPYVTSGCTCAQNDFDVDSDASATAGSVSYASRTAAFSQTFASSTLSATTVWNRDTVTGWTSDNYSLDYGIWDLDATISSYTVGGAPNGNYAVLYTSNYTAAANPPTANPQANTFRLYLPTDAGAAPVKPYLEQQLTHKTAPFTVGVAKEFVVTVRIVNPTARAITFSASNLVTANVPSSVVYDGSAQVGQGSIVSQPSVGGTGNITWNPGTLAAGATAILSYEVLATPSSPGQRIVMTGSAANGTRAQFVDETGNTTQTRATYLLGPLCELAATQGLLTEVLVSSFDASVRGSRTHIEWTTSSEAGTIGFNVLRVDRATGATARVNRNLLPASFGRPQGGRYRLVDDGNSDPQPSYYLEEITVRGATNRYGPFTASGKAVEAPANGGDFDAAPRGTAKKVDRTANGKKAKPVAVMAGVRATGMVKITAAQLATYLNSQQATIDSAIRRGDITITSRGKQVAWTASGDAILFFGEATDSNYANDRVYRIEVKNGGTMMATVSAASANGALSTFTATKETEVDAFAGLGVPVDPESDFWYWDFVIGGDSYYGRRPFTVDATSLASSDNATLEVRLQGAINGAHKARVSVNGAWLGELEWSSLEGKTATIAVPAGVLRDGANEVVIEGLVVNGLGYDVFYVDGFTLRYNRNARPENGTLAMTTTANANVTAGPFAAAPIVLDTADRLRPRVVQTTLANGNVSFVAPSASLFFAESTLEPSFLRATETASLAARSNRADYVIVTPPSLRSGAEALARFRERDGLTTFIADLDQVYDEFAGGNATPHAIRDFITTATTSWSKAPKYIVLAGTGSFDYRGIQGDPGLLPPMLAKTADGLFAADTRFADRNNNGLPEVAIGRIPVSTNDELEAYVRKLEASERTAGTLVLSADARDRAADFRSQSEQSAVFFDGRNATRVYVDAVGAASARTSLLGAWNAARLVTWTGHGGLDRLSGDSLLTTADVPSLTSNGAVPVVVAMTCTINRFELGYVESLGAALTRSGNGGAAAVWSSAGLSSHGNAAELQKTFARLATLTANPRVGDLVVQSLAATPGIGETAMTYMLLGDPAARVSLPSVRGTGIPTARSGE